MGKVAPMARDFWLMTLLALGALLAASHALHAQGAAQCADRDTVVERLASRYGETRQSIGLGHNNSVIEVFASVTTGTWTITVTSASGVTCLIASGEAYESMAEAPPIPAEDA